MSKTASTATTKDVKWEILNPGTFASVKVTLPPQSQIHCESDAIVTMTDHLTLTGSMRGGLFAALMRLFLTEETFFTTAVKTDKQQGGELLLAANEPGDVLLHQLTPQTDLLLTRGSYVAADASVNISTKLQSHVTNAKLSGTGLFLIRAHGEGVIACSAFGAIHKYELSKGEHRIVDNGHLIGWTSNMTYRVGKATSSLVGTFTSGEGLMLHFYGPESGTGTVYVQSHTPKVEILADAAKPRQRKGMLKISVIVVGVLLIIIGLNVYFFLKDHTNWLDQRGEYTEEEL
jgi:uncharacterized protein (TIGR00266 family)